MRECLGVARGNLGCDHVQSDAAELVRGAGEVLVDHVVAQAERLEHLRAGVGRDRGDAHLRHHLEDALAQRLDVFGDRRRGLEVADHTGRDQVVDGFECQVRVDRRCAVRDQQRDVVNLAGLAGLDDQTDLGALAGANEVMVHRGGQ